MTDPLRPGTRIRVVGDVWPQRQGCEGVTVTAPKRTYPQPASGEVLVLLDDDPLGYPSRKYGFQWTCVMRRADVEPIEPASDQS